MCDLNWHQKIITIGKAQGELVDTEKPWAIEYFGMDGKDQCFRIMCDFSSACFWGKTQFILIDDLQ